MTKRYARSWICLKQNFNFYTKKFNLKLVQNAKLVIFIRFLKFLKTLNFHSALKKICIDLWMYFYKSKTH